MCHLHGPDGQFKVQRTVAKFEKTHHGVRLLEHGWMQAARAALSELDRMSGMHFPNTDLPAALRQEYEHTLSQSADRLRKLHLNRQDIQNEELLWLGRRLLQAEKDEVISAFQHVILNRESYNRLLADIGAWLLRIESSEKPRSPRV